MFQRWAGPLISVLILGGVALILVFNLKPGAGTPAALKATTEKPSAPTESPAAPAAKQAGFREYPIGDPVSKNHLEVKAVWLPPVQMEGMADSGSDLIHMEADIHATVDNPNGFAFGEFIPYLKIHYKIEPAGGGAVVQEGEMIPMVARDGLHYGASVAMSKPGAYRLTYSIKPPSSGGLGRHSDPTTGVASWWEPFDAVFEWDYAPAK